MKPAARAFAATLLLFGCSAVNASRIVHQALDRVVAEATLIVSVRIVAVRELAPTELYRTIAVEATPLRVVHGGPSPPPALACRYEEGRPHRRGDMTVSPLVSGSGIEASLQPGQEVLLLIAAADPVHPGCRLLRAEPPAREAAIRAALKNR